MRRADGRRNDLVAATRHDEFAFQDYARLLEVGIATAREGTAWHRIEASAYEFRFESVIRRVRAARDLGVEVVWDLLHFGWPDHLDLFDPTFPDRFARYATAFARMLRDETDTPPMYAPVNEISFVSWAGGDVAYLNPFQRGRGWDVKCQLARAAVAAGHAVRDVDPRARLFQLDPIIHIAPHPDHADSVVNAARHVEGQFEAWDMIAGRKAPEIGGSPAQIDAIGVNFYDRNQWVDMGPSLERGDAQYRPLRDLLATVHQRYGVPLFVAETGTEADGRVPWFRYVVAEVMAARSAGIPVEGICLYPVLDHPGWDDDRHVPVGLWGYPDDLGNRPAYSPLVDELQLTQAVPERA
jgi:beta-glucosidase/6-phospho-beta-glucosidase/beta-galactosidase